MFVASFVVSWQESRFNLDDWAEQATLSEFPFSFELLIQIICIYFFSWKFISVLSFTYVLNSTISSVPFLGNYLHECKFTTIFMFMTVFFFY